MITTSGTSRLRFAVIVLADDFSCRTQLAQLDSGGRRGRHLAEVLADALVRSDRSR